MRAGPSPSQNGIVEGAPPASSTRTLPLSTRRMRQELLPSRITSPAMDSIAKSSSSEPIGRLVGLEHDLVARVVGDRAARGERGQARPAAGLEPSRHPVAVQARRVAAPPRRDALGEHVHDLVEVLAVRARRTGAARRQSSKSAVLVLLLAGADRHDLLGQDVERRAAQGEAVDLAAARRAHQRRALDELVAREREEPALGRGDQGVARAADALERGGDRARRAEQAGEIHRAHVDARARARRSRPPARARPP